MVISGQVSILDCYRGAPSGSRIYLRIFGVPLAYKPLSWVRILMHVPLR